jgi:ferredoxin
MNPTTCYWRDRVTGPGWSVSDASLGADAPAAYRCEAKCAYCDVTMSSPLPVL